MSIITKIMFEGKTNKAVLVLYSALAVGSGFLAIYYNNLLQSIFNDNLLGQNMQTFLPAFLLTVSLYILGFLIKIFNKYILQSFVWRGEERLVRHYNESLLRADYKFFTQKEPADIWTTLNMSSQKSANFYGNVISSIAGMISFIFYGVIVFSVDFYAGLLSVLMIPIYLLLTRGVGKNFMSLQYKIMEHQREMSVTAQESFLNAANVKAKNAYGFFVSRVSTLRKKFSEKMIRFNVLNEYLEGISGIIRIIAPIIILAGAMQLSNSLIISSGNIIVLYINIPIFLSGFSSVYSLFIEYRSSKPALTSLAEFNSLSAEPEGGTEITDFESLSVKNVSVCFSGHTVRIPDITISKGEKVMFFGESGIGKSTLFNIILGLIGDYNGEVFVNGIDLKQVNLRALRQVFGIAFQTPNMFTLTLKDNILLGLPLSDSDKRVNAILGLTGLENQSTIKENQILNNKTVSGGEKSRLGLAQTIIREPEVLLLDETFSNVDEEMEAEIVKRIFLEYPQKTVVCISHRVSSRELFDRTVDFNAVSF